MGRRNETGFELRWREINTAFQTSVEKLREPSWIAPFCPGKIDNRQTAADHLAQYGQVRFDSVNFLRTAAPNPETGDHFIENQKHAVFRAFTAQDRQEIFFRKIKSGVCGNRFQDDRSDFVFVFVERFSDKIDIIEWQRNGELGKRFWNTGAVGPSVDECAAASFYQERIDVAMIAAVEFDNLVAPGESARQSDA